MAYSGLSDFISFLERENELQRIKAFVDPVLEISEVAHRIFKSGGKALLFENTGTRFPLLINAYGSEKRMSYALSRSNLHSFSEEIEIFLKNISRDKSSLFDKISSLPSIFRFAGYLPSYTSKKGICQQVVIRDPDLSIFPILKCWPHDGGRFITLPMVHTIHPVTGKPNVGMYRMQVLGKDITGMHWQRHKTGANHFTEWKKTGRKMPVSVALGGDPVYAYSATAPLPENMNEYILAGFLRQKKVKMVKCLTNDLFVPFDADIILEGYVDPAEELVWEGPFGDHTGFYSLADWYPRFHITCITHSQNAVYPATVVGIPPQEDVWLAKATEKIFLTPVKMTIQPEVEDFHMPHAGVAHNLVIVKINKTYPGQGMKVINSLLGAGQMMFSKYLIVVSGNVDIRNYRELAAHAFTNIDLMRDLIFSTGPLDVLDHSSDAFSFGGKLGIDATVKHPEERRKRKSGINDEKPVSLISELNKFFDRQYIKDYNLKLFNDDIPVLIISVDSQSDPDVVDKIKTMFKSNGSSGIFSIILVVDFGVDTEDLYTVAWQILGNTDPRRDHEFISEYSLLIDGTIKAYKKNGFPRKWPNVVCADNTTIDNVDKKWNSLEIGPLVQSPSIVYKNLVRKGTDEILID